MKKTVSIMTICLISFALVSISVNANAKDKKRIAILDFSANNVSESYAKIVRNTLEVFLYRTKAFNILERNQMELILKEQGLQMTGCTDTSCAVKIGKLLSADYVVIGSLNKMGEYTISVKFVDIGKSSIELADDEAAATEKEIRNSIDKLANRIARKMTGEEAEVRVVKKSTGSSGPLFFGRYSRISAFYSYISPGGAFKDLVEAGQGVTVNLIIDDPIFGIKDFTYGIGAGYWTFEGKEKNTDSVTMIPAYLSLGYRITFIKSLSVLPVISIGASYNTMKYDKDGHLSFQSPEYVSESKAEPFAKAGLFLGYVIFRSFELKIGAEYGTIFEKRSSAGSSMDFVVLNAGLGMMF